MNKVPFINHQQREVDYEKMRYLYGWNREAFDKEYPIEYYVDLPDDEYIPFY